MNAPTLNQTLSVGIGLKYFVQRGNVELTAHSFWFYWFVLFGVILGRYFLLAGGTYFLFYPSLGKSCHTKLRSDIVVETDSGDGETGRRGDRETGRQGDGETRRRGDGETGRRRDGETGRQGDGETGRRGDGEKMNVLCVNATRYQKPGLLHKFPFSKSIRLDIELSILSAVIFAFCAALIMKEYDWGETLLYTDLRKYGFYYLGVSFVAVLILQDAYFYMLHRAFHHPLLFKWLHQGHHRSGKPTPWTSFAFDPLEAVFQSLFFVGIVFIVPLHFITLVAVLMTMTVWALITHLGFELFPSPLSRHLGKWLIGPAHHALHHRKYGVHYGLYFTFWDKLLGTHDPNYEKKFDPSVSSKC